MITRQAVAVEDDPLVTGRRGRRRRWGYRRRPLAGGGQVLRVHRPVRTLDPHVARPVEDEASTRDQPGDVVEVHHVVLARGVGALEAVITRESITVDDDLTRMPGRRERRGDDHDRDQSDAENDASHG